MIIECAACGQKNNVKFGLSDRRVVCGKCGADLLVPSSLKGGLDSALNEKVRDVKSSINIAIFFKSVAEQFKAYFQQGKFQLLPWVVSVAAVFIFIYFLDQISLFATSIMSAALSFIATIAVLISGETEVFGPKIIIPVAFIISYLYRDKPILSSVSFGVGVWGLLRFGEHFNDSITFYFSILVVFVLLMCRVTYEQEETISLLRSQLNEQHNKIIDLGRMIKSPIASEYDDDFL